MPSLSPLSGNLNRIQAAHLLRRATFGPTRQELDELTGMSVSAAVDLLFQAAPIPDDPLIPGTDEAFVNREEFDLTNPGQELIAYIRWWWIKQMAQSNKSAREKMTFFLHSHFTIDGVKVGRAFAIYQMNVLLRQFAFGNFKTLSKKMCRDYAMSVFLDGWTNNVTSPNENFAREFLELYSIGKGEQISDGNYTTYTEDDVQEAARVLTGYLPSGFLPNDQIPPTIPLQTDPDTGLYQSTIVPGYHDPFPKTFSAAFQNTTLSSGFNTAAEIENELDSFINMIFAQDALSEFIVRKLYRFYVYYEISEQVELDIIQPLAAIFRNNNYEFEPVLKALFKSEHFFDADNTPTTQKNVGAIIKSPVELMIGMSRFLQIPIPDISNSQNHYSVFAVLDYFAQQSDMQLFQVPEVAGWPAYHQEPFYNRNWINGTTLVNRFAGLEFIVKGIPVNNGTYTVKLDIVDYLQNGASVSNPFDPNAVVADLVADLFPFGADPAKQATLKDLLLDGDIDAYWATEWANYVNGGPDSVVRLRLENLIDAILQSPEYQLS